MSTSAPRSFVLCWILIDRKGMGSPLVRKDGRQVAPKCHPCFESLPASTGRLCHCGSDCPHLLPLHFRVGSHTMP
eukprot:2613251-Amphidinium_carterae.4